MGHRTPINPRRRLTAWSLAPASGADRRRGTGGRTITEGVWGDGNGRFPNTWGYPNSWPRPYPQTYPHDNLAGKARVSAINSLRCVIDVSEWWTRTGSRAWVSVRAWPP